jgi:hypothetical protein
MHPLFQGQYLAKCRVFENETMVFIITVKVTEKLKIALHVCYRNYSIHAFEGS